MNKNNNFKKIFVLLCLLSLYIIISAISYVNAVSLDLANNVFRLHVIANSDSCEDQILKYKVRDAVISYLDKISPKNISRQETILLVENHLDEFLSVAKSVVESNGYNYDISINVGNFYFPTKTYGDISLPAGNYDALRIEIGKASGQNWWCVMFPPLCFVDVSSGIVPEESKEMLESNLSTEEYAIISNENEEISFKFKLLELFNNVTHTLTAKK